MERYVVMAGGMIAALALLAMCSEATKPEDTVKRIERACAEQYGSSQDQLETCKIRLATEALYLQDTRKADAARDRAGIQ